MQRIADLFVLLTIVAFTGVVQTQTASAADGLDALANASKSSQRASQVARQLQRDPETRLLDVLGAMKGKSAIAKNWYVSVAQAVADRDPDKSRSQLEQFLPRLSEDPDARYWVFNYLTGDNTAQREEFLESMLADPSLDLRYEAVELHLKRLAADKNRSKAEQISGYRELLAAARLPAQVQGIAKKLDELGTKVDLLKHLGFISKWHVAGSFDNVDQIGFDIAYAPEGDYVRMKTATLSADYKGKSGQVSWQEASTDAPNGAVDLNAVFDNEKGAIAYASGQFKSGAGLDCQVRIGSPNACKVWVNGQLIISREVYHAATQIDQYIAPVKLRAGSNSILVKLCQNEQTDSWAQGWEFQIRFTDSSGYAIQPVQ